MTAAPDSKEALLQAYRLMKTIREFEERAHREFATGEMPGFVHLYAGQEAVAVGTCANLREDDYIASTHRGHGHAIAKGCDVMGMMAELYGRATGLCRGKGGSMHIADLSTGMLGANGIVGGGPPLVCGVGLSAKVRGTDQVGVSFTGDARLTRARPRVTEPGSGVGAPGRFVVENNGYAESTATIHQSGIDVAKRADGFGLPGVVDGHDFCGARGGRCSRPASTPGEGPSLVECKTDRSHRHFEGDQQVRASGESNGSARRRTA